MLGGYIPATSKLLRLDLGIVGIPGLSKIQGIPNVAPDGTFTTTYKFGHYQGVVRFWLQVSSLAEADFPFSPSHSKRWIVTVGVPAPKEPPPTRLTAERATSIGARRSIDAPRAANSSAAAGRDGDERSDPRRAQECQRSREFPRFDHGNSPPLGDREPPLNRGTRPRGRLAVGFRRRLGHRSRACTTRN